MNAVDVTLYLQEYKTCLPWISKELSMLF